ncbi:MAG TPA: alpha/beta hydrolase fold domain-containing protein [Verrucomicrobiae bacterium]|nr:alpha/beta hydrolase fold domain-containing protein [Verrucomicrobiae bacterium]
MKPFLLPFFLSAIFLMPSARTFAAPNDAESAKQVYKTVGNRKLTLSFDYPPEWKPSDKRPAVVFFFGGGWSHGSPSQFEPQAKYFAKRGLVCARADYRLRGKDGVTPDKCVEDAISAMRWVRSHAAQFGIDPNRIVAAGGSAGGHLAACTFFVDDLAAPDDEKSVSPKPNAMILYNPVLDLVAVRAERAVRSGHYFAGVDDATLKRISPGLYLRKDMPPTLILDGTMDWLHSQILGLVAKAKSMGAPVEAWYADGQPHGFFNKQPWLAKTTEQADAFLCRIGYLREEPKVPLPTSEARR